MKTSTKLNSYVSIAVGVSLPAIMLSESFPADSLLVSLWIVCQSIGLWIGAAILIFLVNWVFFGALFLLGKWIWESFYRTPTL